MKTITTTAEYTISQRRDGRYAVKGSDKQPINGDDKVKILLENGLIKAPPVKEPEPEEAAEEATEETAAEAADDAAEGEAS